MRVWRDLFWNCAAFLSTAAALATADTRVPAVPSTDPNRGLFPASSVVDFRYLLDAPAGKRGFLTARGGHFYWADGTRGKFWGVNISSRSVWVDHSRIEQVAEVLARAGCNMVRFEALDTAEGILDVPGSNSSRALNSDRLERLDYWIAQLKKRGIYVYLDLLDFRQFKAGDGVPAWDQLGRAAKPCAVFDDRLIALQEEYARQLLTHRNPYTGLRYVDDPAIALIEVCNEHGLFMKAAELDTLPDYYALELRRLWSEWLVQRYRSRDALALAWKRASGREVLQPFEDPASGTVALPLFARSGSQAEADKPGVQGGILAQPGDPRTAPARVADGVRFLYDMQRRYFRRMHLFLRTLGVKVPITGVVSSDIPPDLASVADEMDFTAENYYFDHPAFTGKDWEGAFFYNDTNPIRFSSVYQIAPWLAALRWQGKPVVVREWAVVWPNRYRAVAMPEMAAYAGLQDFDAVLLFGYQVERDPGRLGDFDHQADPTVWGLFGLAAQCFLRGDVKPSPYVLTMRYSDAELFRWPSTLGDLYRCAWAVRIESEYTPGPADHGSSGVERSPARTRTRLAARGRRGSKGNRARVIAKDLEVSAGDRWLLPQVLERFRMAGASCDALMFGAGVLKSATGEIIRRTQAGRLELVTPRAIAVCGELPCAQPVHLGDWTVVTGTAVGAFMAVSLDGAPLSRSRRYVMKMVSVAQNSGQELQAAQSGAPGKWLIKNWGRAPIRTLGESSTLPTRILLGGRQLVSLDLRNGTWEVSVSEDQATLVCDTPGIRVSLFGQQTTTAPDVPIVVDLSLSRQTAREE
ncbi:MAG: hypothetical protein ACP5VE_03540 [Chthonomonadales bacterium]